MKHLSILFLIVLVSWSGTNIPCKDKTNRIYIYACSYKAGDRLPSLEKSFYLSVTYCYGSQFCEYSRYNKLFQDSVHNFIYIDNLDNGRYVLNATKDSLIGRLEFIKTNDSEMYLNLFLQ